MSPRKISKLPTRIWKFAARFASREDATLATDLLFASSRYYNALVRIERDRSARFRLARGRYSPELVRLEDEWADRDAKISEIYRSCKESRTRYFQEGGGKKRLLTPEFQTQVDALKREQKDLSEAAKELRRGFAALLKPAQEEYKRRSTERLAGRGPRIKQTINAEVLAEMLVEDQWSPEWKEIAHSDKIAHAESIRARNLCALPTGTYLGVEEAFQRAKEDSLPLAPGFHGFKKNGRLRVQSRNVNYADLLAGTSSISIKPAPLNPNKKAGKNRIMLARMDQSIPRGSSQAISATILLHREPPADARVKWATWVIRKEGSFSRVELQLTLEHESFAESKRPSGMLATEHVKIGWSKATTGIRIASVPGIGDIVCPQAIFDGHEYGAQLTGQADSYFDQAKKLLRRMMRKGPNRLTSWHHLQSDRDRASLRRSCEAYASYVLGDIKPRWRAWIAERRGQSLDLYAMPSAIRRRHPEWNQDQVFAFWCLLWAKKDFHLLEYAIVTAKKFRAKRDAFFRKEAIKIATLYDAVTVDNYNIAALKKLEPLTMPGESPRDASQHQLQSAAPGRFREILQEVMGDRCTLCERPGDTKTETAKEELVAREAS